MELSATATVFKILLIHCICSTRTTYLSDHASNNASNQGPWIAKVWFNYLLEHLGRSSDNDFLSPLGHYKYVHLKTTQWSLWCDRRFDTNQDRIHVGRFIPCGKIVVDKKLSSQSMTSWSIEVNYNFYVLLNFTRFSIDSSMGHCTLSKLRSVTSYFEFQ